MSIQNQRLVDTREFRIVVIAVAAVAVLAVAAYLFGTGLRADTSASLAPSPLGSSLTVDRESAAAAPGRSADSSAVDYASLGLRSAAGSASAESSAVDYASLGLRPAAGSASAGSSAVDYASLGLRSAAGSASAGSSAVDYASLGLRSAASRKPESLADLEARWAGFYAGLDRALKDAGARP